MFFLPVITICLEGYATLISFYAAFLINFCKAFFGWECIIKCTFLVNTYLCVIVVFIYCHTFMQAMSYILRLIFTFDYKKTLRLFNSR